MQLNWVPIVMNKHEKVIRWGFFINKEDVYEWGEIMMKEDEISPKPYNPMNEMSCKENA